METVLTRLPRYSRGLRLVRLGVFIMLAQQVLILVITARSVGASASDDAIGAVTWLQYGLWTHIGATLAMLIGSLLALPDFRFARLPIQRVLLAAAGFAFATAALAWTHHVLSNFIDIVRDPNSTLDAMMTAVEDLESLKLAAVTKDLAYGVGLIAVLRMVRQSAVANDQLGLRDAASNLTGLLVLMVIADLFYQVTFGLGSGSGVLPLFGLLASVLVAGYWIYCHVRLTRFLENAAYFVNEPHHVPTATVVSNTTVGEKPRPSARTIAPPRRDPSAYDSAPVIVVAPEVRPTEAPRAETDSGERPRFLT